MKTFSIYLAIGISLVLLCSVSTVSGSQVSSPSPQEPEILWDGIVDVGGLPRVCFIGISPNPYDQDDSITVQPSIISYYNPNKTQLLYAFDIASDSGNFSYELCNFNFRDGNGFIFKSISGIESDLSKIFRGQSGYVWGFYKANNWYQNNEQPEYVYYRPSDVKIRQGDIWHFEYGNLFFSDANTEKFDLGSVKYRIIMTVHETELNLQVQQPVSTQ